MSARNTIAGVAAAGGILLAVMLASPAVAATNASISINIGTFHDRLEPYGAWVSYRDQYVFVPENVDPDWRPYTRGRWSYTDRHGWLWVSYEDFGWATYHYGRWGYSHNIGWYWVPGHDWAPAWVVWSHGDHEVAWAPLPPRYGYDIEISISIGDIPDYCWQAVRVSAFLSFDLSGEMIRDRHRVRAIVRQAAPQTVRIENNIVINKAIGLDYVEKATMTKVRVLEEKTADAPEAAGKTDANSVAIFSPEVRDEAIARPKKTRKFEEVAAERKANGIQPEDQPADQTAAPVAGYDQIGEPIAIPGQPDADAQQPSAGNSAPEPRKTMRHKKTADDLQANDLNEQEADEPDRKRNKKSVQPADAGQTEDNASVIASPVVKFRKHKAVVIQPGDSGNAPVDAPASLFKNRKAFERAVPHDAQQIFEPQDSGQERGEQKSYKRRKKAFDMAVPHDAQQVLEPQDAGLIGGDQKSYKRMKKVFDTVIPQDGQPIAELPEAGQHGGDRKSSKRTQKEAGAYDQTTIDQNALDPLDAQTLPARGRKKRLRTEEPEINEEQD